MVGVAERDGVGEDDALNGTGADAVNRGFRQDGVGAASRDRGRTTRDESLGTAHNRASGIYHVVNDDAVLAKDISDNLGDLHFIGRRAASSGPMARQAII